MLIANVFKVNKSGLLSFDCHANLSCMWAECVYEEHVLALEVIMV